MSGRPAFTEHDPPFPHDVLFVHGGNHGAWCWHLMQQYLAQHYSVTSHAVNLRGHGNSWGRAQLDATGLDDFAADVLQVIESISADRPYVLVGHSMGGFVLLRYLWWLTHEPSLPHPAALVTMGIAAPHEALTPWHFNIRRPGMLGHPLEVFLSLVQKDNRRMLSTPERIREYYFSPGADDATVTRCFDEIQHQPEAGRVIGELIHMSRSTEASILASHVPLFLMGGELDAVCDARAVTATAERWGVSSHIFAGVGHDLMLEHSFQEVADYLVQACLMPPTSPSASS